MKTSLMLKSTLLVAVGSFLATGCVVRERVVYRPPPPPPVTTTYVVPAPPPAPVVVPAPEVVVAEAPPALMVEAVPGPRPGYVWVPGAWVWHGRWNWERGHFVQPPHRGGVWVPGRYEVHGGRHVYIGGRWR